jgi:GR25 family glycosyltransferase involved in LPS biosynthesis
MTTEAYLLRPAYAERLLTHTRRWLDPIDGQMQSAVQAVGGGAYRASPGLFVQDPGLGTDIQ